MKKLLSPGKTLCGGTYQIVKPIHDFGCWSFCCIYEAKHVIFGERVVIKELFPGFLCYRCEDSSISVYTHELMPNNLEFFLHIRKLFIQEALDLRKVSFPGIIRVTDVFEENNTVYIVMNYVAGTSLNKIIDAQGAFSETKALYYIRQLANTLHYIHMDGRIHFDISPENILIDSKNNTILIDFDYAKSYYKSNGEYLDEEFTDFNDTNLLYQPVEYVSPHKRNIQTSDVYSLGACLYNLLTGKNPISCFMLLEGGKNEQLPPNVSFATNHAIELALSFYPKDRPQSIKEFLSILPSLG